RIWNELTHNPPDHNELGVLTPIDPDWSISFEFDDIGYVKDDEKDKLDADALLKSVREGTEEANAYRRSKHWSEITVVGWQQPPAYDQDTKRLVWSIKGRSGDHEGVNYDTRVLGRRGVMKVKLVAGVDELAEIVPVFNKLLKGFEFSAGQRYDEWRS